MLINSGKADLPGWDYDPDYIKGIKETLRQTDVKEADLEYYRCIFDLFSKKARESQSLVFRKVDVPSLKSSIKADKNETNR